MRLRDIFNRNEKLPVFTIPNTERLAICADTHGASISLTVEYGHPTYSVVAPTHTATLEVATVLGQELASMGIYCVATDQTHLVTLSVPHGK